jgi:hypothetical protein
MTERDIKQYYLGMMAGLRLAKFTTISEDVCVYLNEVPILLEEAIKKIREERDMNLRICKEEGE